MNINKLTAITAMPAMSPYMDKWCSPYSLADGKSSSKLMYTMMPATEAKIKPNMASLKKL